MLRPMANLFAVTDPDRGFLEAMAEQLEEAEEFDAVWHPAPGWLAASAPLPESEPDSDSIRSRGFAFVEGRDRLERGNGLGWLDRVSELADRSPQRLAELPGDFTFVRFRPDGTALSVRSCAGVAPVYLHRRASGGFAIGTLLNYFPRFLPGRFLADPLINACWEPGLVFIGRRSFVEGISILPRAGYAELATGHGPETGTYWDPRPDVGDEPRATPEHARELRRILVETLERDLDPAGRNLLALSGGVDSTSVGALAAGVVGRGLSSWSLIPHHEPARSQELRYIDPLVEEFGISPAHKCEDTEELVRRWRKQTRGLPFHILNPALLELPRICDKQDVRVLVGGEFADHVCGHWIRINDWTRYTSLWRLLTRPDLLPFGARDYVRWTRRRLMDAVNRPLIPFPDRPPAWVPTAVEAEYRDWFRARRIARARDRRPLKELADHVAADAWVDMNWEGATPLGVRRCLPFFNREVLELAFRCHPSELLGPGPKRLLRDAVGGDVPPHNLLRPDKGGWGRGQPAPRVTLDAEIPAGADRLVRDGWLPAPPADAAPEDIAMLRHTIRVVAYLEAQANSRRWGR
jgi:hypothetical protein